MPKITSQRTFTACWTCRRRNIRCDTKAPICTQCSRSGLRCDGYDLSLVWIDPETGHYEPKLRRTYPCQLTWAGYPTWTSKEVDHLITFAEKRMCRCSLHQLPNPFGNFDAVQGPSPSKAPEVPFSEDCTQAPDVDQAGPSDNEPPCISESDTTNTPSTIELSLSSSIPWSLSSPWVPQGSKVDNELFHHYISSLAPKMTPIDDHYNPWKSTYPSLAIQAQNSSSACALFHGILAQSAFHRANMSHASSPKYRRVATQHYCLSLRHLRRSLDDPTENFSSNLAAMLTVTLTNHCFQGELMSLKYHLLGAIQYVKQHLGQKPWLYSHETWVITQSFVLHTLMSRIAGDVGVNSLNTDTDTTFCQVLEDVTTNPTFAYTIGSTPQLIRALYQAQRLESQLATQGLCTGDKPHLSLTQFLEASEILMELNGPLDTDLELYISRQRPTTTSAEQRCFIVANLNIFRSAVSIYLICTVLHHPPSAVANQVMQILSTAAEILDPERAAVSIWPIFVAAAEAYTPAAQALADHVLTVSAKLGASNRRTIHYVVKCIWAAREERAFQQGCEVGGVRVDWRQVLKELGVDILLL